MSEIKKGVVLCTLSIYFLWGCSTQVKHDAPAMQAEMATATVMAEPLGRAEKMSYAFMPPRPTPVPTQNSNTQQYQEKVDNPIKRVSEHPVSTFSIDVDTGSYTNARQMIWRGQNIRPEGIRAEEFINYFSYDYPKSNNKLPFSTQTLLTTAPWSKSHQLLRIALQAQDIQAAHLPATNLVYLIDVSGSMAQENKLDLVKRALLEMVDQLRPQDKVSIVTYSGKEDVVLSGVSGQDKAT